MRGARRLAPVVVAAVAGALGGRLSAPPPSAVAAAPVAVTSRPHVALHRAAPIEAPVAATEDAPAPTPSADPARPPSADSARAPSADLALPPTYAEMLDADLAEAPFDAAWAGGAERTMREALGGEGRLQEVRCGGDLCRFALALGDEGAADAFHGGLAVRYVRSQISVRTEELADGHVLMTVYVQRPQARL